MVGIDQRVPAFLGRILDDDNAPIGTCFQVTPGVLATAWHLLDDLGVGKESASVRLDPLQGGPTRNARVERIDQGHDLAVLVTSEPLTDCVAGLAATDTVPMATPIVVTGVAIMNDPGHSYSHLDTNGHWAGGTIRDDKILLGRVVADALMKGMSGAPVLSGQFAIGVVSARYNSGDEWGRNSVWVARTEDLTPLLAGLDNIELSRSDSAQTATSRPADGHAETAPTPEPQRTSTMGGDGVFVVGLDIRPGVYRTAGAIPGRNGYYALLSSTDTSDIINNNNFTGPATITVGPEVKAVTVSDCQPWFWQGPDLDAAIRTAHTK
jgi:hypothetical protein